MKTYAIFQPEPQVFVYWDGGNVDEIRDTWPQYEFTVEGTTLITPGTNVPVSMWTNGTEALPTGYFGKVQEVPGPGPYHYMLAAQTPPETLPPEVSAR